MGGPFWAEPLHDPAWISAILQHVQVRCNGRHLIALARSGISTFLTTVALQLSWNLDCSKHMSHDPGA